MDPRAIRYPAETIRAKSDDVRARMLRESKSIRRANFDVVGVADLARLFQLYDEGFLGGSLARAIESTAGAALTFRLSSTMTRAGGKTSRRVRRMRNGTVARQFEIAIATRMLFLNFRDGQRGVTVCGLACGDRLAALQRIMEHEILHLAEFLLWGKSSCSGARFKALARNIFGHEASHHDLITVGEVAAKEHAVAVGSAVEFEFAGEVLAGFVNRINQRATVLVEARDGARYRNGRRYRKYYIPLRMLRPVGKDRD